MKAIRNNTLPQALELLNYLNTELESVYMPEEGIIKHFIHWYVPILEDYRYLFPLEVLDRECFLDLTEFSLVGQPEEGLVFNLGTDIKSRNINISNNGLEQSTVDNELNNLVNNFSEFKDGVRIDIGGVLELPLFANSKPSDQTLSLLESFAENNPLHVNFWDGQKNISLESNRISIKTNNSYEIIKKDVLTQDAVHISGISEGSNLFVMSKSRFSIFAEYMRGVRYNESDFKCFILFDDNLDIKQVFEKGESEELIELEGLNLAYAPFDFLFTVINIPQLGAPDLEVWNEFIVSREFNQEKTVKVFPNVDLKILNE